MREFGGLPRQGFEGGDTLAGALAALPDVAERRRERLALRSSLGRSGDARGEAPIQDGEFAQGRDGGEVRPRVIRQTAESGRRPRRQFRQRQPGRKEHQIVLRRPALPGQRFGPDARFIVGRSLATAGAGERSSAGRQVFETGPQRRQGSRRGGAEGVQFPA
jgi:hypothetical protein